MSYDEFRDLVAQEFQYANDRALMDGLGGCPICGRSAAEHPKGFDKGSCLPRGPGPRGILASIPPSAPDPHGATRS